MGRLDLSPLLVSRTLVEARMVPRMIPDAESGIVPLFHV
jgi:hypothetical protein